MATISPIAAGVFDSGAVAVTDDTNWVEVCKVNVQGQDDYVRLDGAVGAGGALAALKLTSCATPGGTHIDWITDFSTATTEKPYNSATPQTTGANGNFSIKLQVGGVGEVGVYAKKATGDTTVRITGSIQPP